MNKMRSMLLSIAFLSIINIQADTVTYTYRSELTLSFLKHGVNGFLDLAKKASLEHFQYAPGLTHKRLLNYERSDPMNINKQ